MKDLNQDQILHYTADELALYRDKINKEIERRNGKDIDIKKIRAQVYRLAKALGCEWVSQTYQEDSQQDTDKPKRRGRKPKTEETSTETAEAPQTTLQTPTAHVGNIPVEEEKRKSLW